MCGINGFISKSELSNSFFLIKEMNDLITHRGPDDFGEFVENNDRFSIAFGMRRLSVIDIDNGSQPIYSQDKKLIIVFNGEIYNYQELKDELINEGFLFNTNSDTEVILKLYEKEGVSSFSRLDGMFTFSIYDKKLEKVFIARDYFGEKPLFYTHLNNSFIVAS